MANDNYVDNLIIIDAGHISNSGTRQFVLEPIYQKCKQIVSLLRCSSFKEQFYKKYNTNKKCTIFTIMNFTRATL